MGQLREWLVRLGALLTRRARAGEADLDSQLFGVSATDAASLAGAFALMAAAATVAHVGPLRRAWRIDPTVALREN